LRLFSNYLTPRKGLLSADTWRAIAVVSRNLALTWMVLLPVLLAATMLAQMYFLANASGAYGIACVSAPDTSAASPVATRPAICLSMTDHMPSAVRDSVTGRSYPSVLRDRLVMSTKPLLVILGWTAAAGLAWLLVGSANLRNMLGTLLALAIVATALVSASDRLALWKGDASGQTWDWVGMTAALGSAIILCFWWLVPTLRDPQFLLGRGQQDRRDTQSNRATRLQSMLLVGLAASAAVLGFGGFGHDAFSYLFTTRAGSPLGDALRRAGGWGALLITIGSAVATAVYASPAGGGEKSRSEPTVPVALLLALTPVLVIVVLAILTATLAHWLLVHLLTYNAPPSEMSLLLPWLVLAIPGLLWAWREIRNTEGGRLRQAARVVGVLLLTVMVALAGQWAMGLRSSLDPLDAALLLSLTVCGLLTGLEYVTDARQNSRAARFVIAITAGVVALAATRLLSPLLLGTLEQVHEGWLAEPPPGMRRPAGVFVGMVVGFTIARLCVTWTPRSGAPPVLMLRYRAHPGDPWTWIDLALATLIGGGLGWLVSGMYISPDARPVAGVPWTTGSPTFAWLCLLGLTFSSAFVLLDLVCSRTRAAAPSPCSSSSSSSWGPLSWSNSRTRTAPRSCSPARRSPGSVSVWVSSRVWAG
jgi:hypothetical protein